MSDELVQIELIEHASGSPKAIELCLRGWNELFGKGLTDGRLIFHEQMSAILGYTRNGRDVLPVGVVLFGLEPEFRRTWITLSYVDPEFRGRGIYNAMWKGIVAASHAKDIRSIESATHVRNSAMREVAKRQGRIEEFVILVHRIAE